MGLNDGLGLGLGHMDWVNKLDPSGSIVLEGKDKSAHALLFWLDKDWSPAALRRYG